MRPVTARKAPTIFLPRSALSLRKIADSRTVKTTDVVDIAVTCGALGASWRAKLKVRPKPTQKSAKRIVLPRSEGFLKSFLQLWV